MVRATVVRNGTSGISSTAFVQNNPWLPAAWLDVGDPRGVQLKQENVLNLNSVSIVLILVPFSYLVARMKVLSAMTLGILIAIFGILVSGTTTSIYVLFVGIVLFSVGEMLTGPKKSEYFALIAPPGKKALYLYAKPPRGSGRGYGECPGRCAHRTG